MRTLRCDEKQSQVNLNQTVVLTIHSKLSRSLVWVIRWIVKIMANVVACIWQLCIVDVQITSRRTRCVSCRDRKAGKLWSRVHLVAVVNSIADSTWYATNRLAAAQIIVPWDAVHVVDSPVGGAIHWPRASFNDNWALRWKLNYWRTGAWWSKCERDVLMIAHIAVNLIIKWKQNIAESVYVTRVR